MIDSKTIRAKFPHTKNSIYFNVASAGPYSIDSYQILDEHYKTCLNARLGSEQNIFAALENIRRSGKKLFGCSAQEIGYGFNTSFGINLAAFGLPLQKGDEVLLSDVEFPANVYPWLELRNRGVKIKFVKSGDGFLEVDDFEKAITKRTKVIATSSVQFFNGYKIDLRSLGEICKSRNIFFVVDAMQGTGCEPINVRKCNINIATAGGQKWLLSPQGSGLFYISDETKQILDAPWRSWLGVDWKCDWTNLNDYTRQFESSARQYEMGTYPGGHVLAFDNALSFLTGLGISNIQKHNHGLIDRLVDYLQSEPVWRVVSSLDKKHRSSILSFTTDTLMIKDVHRQLLKNKIVTAVREGAIRVSVHLYNDASDIDKLINILKQSVRATK